MVFISCDTVVDGDVGVWMLALHWYDVLCDAGESVLVVARGCDRGRYSADLCVMI